MVRSTSIDAYHEVVECGWVGKQQLAIYRHMYANGPLTSGECYYLMHKGSVKKSLTQGRARFTELRSMGLLCEKGKRKCSITGKTVILWDVTDLLPVKPKKDLTKDQKIARLKQALEYIKPKVDKVVWHKAIRILKDGSNGTGTN